MDKYQSAHSNYIITIGSTVGCGDRGQMYINGAYEDLVYAYKSLSPEERAKVTMPKLYRQSDDGTGGLGSGLLSGVLEKKSSGAK
jgi:hypothetical protein